MPSLQKSKSAKDILLECSSGVALAVNTSRTGFITRQELAEFFYSVNCAYSVPNAAQAGEQRADDILTQVGQEISTLGAVKLKKICVKLEIDISNFLEKADYVRSVTAVTGSARVAALFSFSAWLHQTFIGYPEKLQRIQDIALDHLVQQSQTRGSYSSSSSDGGSSSSDGSSTNSTSASNEGSEAKSKTFRVHSGEYSGVSRASSGRFSTSPNKSDNDGSSSRTTGIDTPDTPKTEKRKKRARRRTMAALNVFSKLDKNNNGSVSRRDFLIALRKDPDVANFLGLPQKITQEGDTRDKLEHVFQGISRTTSDSDTVSIDEFVEHFRRTSLHGKGN
jgi:hypothetical protein